MTEVPKPELGFRPHEGPYRARSMEEIVRDPGGRAWLAAHISTQGPGRQRLGLAWLAWGLQREVTLADLAEISAAD